MWGIVCTTGTQYHCCSLTCDYFSWSISLNEALVWTVVLVIPLYPRRQTLFQYGIITALLLYE